MAHAVQNLLFRDVGLVMPSIVPFTIAFAGVNHLLRQAEQTTHSNPNNPEERKALRGPLGSALDAAHGVGRWVGEKISDDPKEQQWWADNARTALRTGLLIGSAFTAFNLPYAASKEVFNRRQGVQEAARDGKPPPLLPEAPNQHYDGVGRGMTTGVGKLIFRDAGSIFMGALALGATAVGVRKFVPAPQAKGQGDDGIGKRWLKDYSAAGLGYVAFYETMLQYRKAYDGFWKRRDEKQHARAESKSLEEYKAEHPDKPKGRYGFFTEGLGKVVFRDAASVLLGFAPHRGIRMVMNDLMDLHDTKDPLKSENALVQKVMKAFGAGPDNPERAKMVGDTLREGVGTGFGFTAGYMLFSEAYRQAYDALFKRLEGRASGMGR